MTIHFTNNGSSWEIQLNEDFTNALLGNAGLPFRLFKMDPLMFLTVYRIQNSKSRLSERAVILVGDCNPNKIKIPDF